MRDILFNIIGGIFILAIFVFIFLYGTSKEVWYAGMHDSKHEGENCHCYERLVADPNN